jgi:hypothetical protein
MNKINLTEKLTQLTDRFSPRDHVLLFEPASTLNTGNVRNERTVENLSKI